jgi:hypothetical protein
MGHTRFWSIMTILILRVAVYILYRDTCVFTVASKKSGLEVNIDSTEYVVMSQEQNGVQNSELRYQLYLLNMWQNLKYSGTTSTNQNLLH